jgi:hypothetical protein
MASQLAITSARITPRIPAYFGLSAQGDRNCEKLGSTGHMKTLPFVPVTRHAEPLLAILRVSNDAPLVQILPILGRSDYIVLLVDFYCPGDSYCTIKSLQYKRRDGEAA